MPIVYDTQVVRVLEMAPAFAGMHALSTRQGPLQGQAHGRSQQSGWPLTMALRLSGFFFFWVCASGIRQGLERGKLGLDSQIYHILKGANVLR